MNETAKRAPVERIVGRLRQYVILRTEADNDSRRHDLMLDAADEIERLQAENGALRNRLVSEIRNSEPSGFECTTAEAEAKVNEYLDRFRAAMDQRKKPPNARANLTDTAR